MPGLIVRTVAAAAAFAAGLHIANADELGPTLQRIKDTGIIAISYREGTIPLSYAVTDGQPAGLALDLCGLVAASIKDRLGLPDLKVTYQLATASEAASLLEKSAIAIDCGATPVTPELEKQAVFSNPVFISELTWLVPRR